MLLLAKAYRSMNEDFRAQQAVQKLLARYPDDPRRAEAEALLAAASEVGRPPGRRWRGAPARPTSSPSR